MTFAACVLALTLAPSSVPYEWNSVAIVGGGFVTGVIAHPTAKDVVYARTDIGGAYRLDPKTRRWIPLQDFLKRSQWNWYGGESVALDPSNPKRVLMAVGTYTNNWSGNGVIFRSEDEGRTWAITELPFKNGGNMPGRSIGERLAIDPHNARIAYFGTRHNGLWSTADGGASWSSVESFPKRDWSEGVGIGWVLFDEASKGDGRSQRIWVGPALPDMPIHLSTDGGASWKPIEGGPKQIPHHAELSREDTLFLAYSNDPGPNGVTDGSVWKRSSDGVWTDITPLKPTAQKGFGYAGLSLDRTNQGTLVVSTLCRWGQDTLFRSRDGGKTWVSIAETASIDVSKSPNLKWDRGRAEFGHWIGDVEIDPFQPDRIWYVTGATIHESKDATTIDRGLPTHWVVAAEGIEETAVLDLASPPSGVPLVSALGDIGGFTHENFNVSPPSGMWLNPLLSNVDQLDFSEQNPSIFLRVGRSYGGNQHGAISRDGSRTWSPLKTDPPGSRSGSGSAVLCQDGKVVVWAAQGADPHWTGDLGVLWTRCEGLPQGVRLASDRVMPNVVYAQHNASRKLYRSDDAGKTFAALSDLPAGELGRIATVFSRPGHLWLPSESGLRRSTDAGKTLISVASVQTAEAISFGVPRSPGDYPTLFLIGRVGGVEGAFGSTDEGETWVQINDDKTGFGTMMRICGDRRVFGRAYIGTNGRGILVANPKPVSR